MNPIAWFRQHGVDVFPIQPGTKEPAVPRGTSWKNYQGPVGLPYGVELDQLIVPDGDSFASTAWIRTYCPPTPFMVTTGPYHDPRDPGRGTHFYYRYNGSDVPAFIHRDGLTIELKRAGQYVVGPRSRHPSGLVYTPANWSWRWEDIPVFPADFLFDDRPPEVRSTDGHFEFPEFVIAGERHHMLFRQLRSWRHVLEQDEAYAAILDVNECRCRPPLKVDEQFKKWFKRAWNLTDRPFLRPVRGLTELRGL